MGRAERCAAGETFAGAGRARANPASPPGRRRVMPDRTSLCSRGENIRIHTINQQNGMCLAVFRGSLRPQMVPTDRVRVFPSHALAPPRRGSSHGVDGRRIRSGNATGKKRRSELPPSFSLAPTPGVASSRAECLWGIRDQHVRGQGVLGDARRARGLGVGYLVRRLRPRLTTDRAVWNNETLPGTRREVGRP